MAAPNLDQLVALQRANAEVLSAVIRSALGGLEKLTALNLGAGRDLIDNTVSNVEKLMSIKNPADVSRIGNSLAQPNVEKLVAYSQNVYDLVTDLQKEVTSIVEGQYQSFARNAAGAVEQAKTAPVGGDVFAAALNSVLEASNKAFETMNAASRQLSELAEANVKAASEVASKVAPVAPAAAPVAAAPAAAPAAPAPARGKKAAS